MKKIHAILLALVFSSVLFSGCNLLSGSPEAAPVAVDSDSILDDSLFMNAVNTQDATKCATILDATKKSDCQATVEAMILTDQAVYEMDSSLCNQISLDRYESNCKAMVKAEEDRQEYLEAREEKINEDVKEVSDIINTNDLEGCAKVKDANLRAVCELNILSDRAYEKGEKFCVEGDLGCE